MSLGTACMRTWLSSVRVRRCCTSRMVLILSLLLLITAAGCGQQDDENERPPTAVSVTTLELRDLTDHISFSARTRAVRDGAAIAELGGRVATVAVEADDEVSAGDFVVQLDDSDQRLQLNEANAAVRAAQAALEEAEEMLETAQQEYDRIRPLYEEGEVSQIQYDITRSLLNSARRQAEDIIPAELARAQAARDAAQRAVRRMRITAPFSGTVAEVMVSPGDVIGAGTPVVQLVDLSSIRLRGGVGESTVQRLSTGMPAEVELTAEPGRTWSATVLSVGLLPNPEVGGYPVQVELPNSDQERWRPGLSARIQIIVATREQVLAVPAGALTERGGEAGVFVIEVDTAVWRAVTTGVRDGDYVEILEGLDQGEKIVASSPELLRDGETVRVVEGRENDADDENGAGGGGS